MGKSFSPQNMSPCWSRQFMWKHSPVYIFTRLSQYYKHFVSQYLVSNVFWIRPMAIGLQIGYRCIATTPCLSARDPAGAPLPIHFLPATLLLPLPHVLYPLFPFFSVAFVVWVSPQLFCMGTRSVFIAVPASIVNVLPSVHWQIPLFPPSPIYYWVFVLFPASPTPGRQVAKITTQLFGRDSSAITNSSAPVIPKHPHLVGLPAEVWISCVLTAFRLRR